jgi:nucleotide-binding universal stress UspA family protein
MTMTQADPHPPASCIVVGYDGSDESDFALQWAARVAQRRRCPLQVVSATEIDRTRVDLASPEREESYLRQAQQTAEAGAQRAREIAGIEVQAAGWAGDAANSLLESAQHAALIVVGHRARGVLPDTVLGSVAFKLSHHAPCPVAVVPRSPRPLPSMEHPVVAGIDGSDHAERALQEAARLAADTGSWLRIVVAGEPRQAQQLASQAAARVQARHPTLTVRPAIDEEPADQAILAQSRDASLIVVGARGLGGLQGLLLGSVSKKVMQGAECAVYVVR